MAWPEDYSSCRIVVLLGRNEGVTAKPVFIEGSRPNFLGDLQHLYTSEFYHYFPTTHISCSFSTQPERGEERERLLRRAKAARQDAWRFQRRFWRKENTEGLCEVAGMWVFRANAFVPFPGYVRGYQTTSGWSGRTTSWIWGSTGLG